MHIDPLSARFAAGDPIKKASAAAGAEFRSLMPQDRVELSDGIPASPPPEALAEVDAAWELAAQLRAEGRELRFSHSQETGQLVIEVRDLAGNVVRRIPPTEALAIAAREVRP